MRGHAQSLSVQARHLSAVMIVAIVAVGLPFSVVTQLARPLPAEASSGSAYANTVLADSPIAYWRLGETSGTTASDATGHGWNGTINPPVTLGQPGAITGDTDPAMGFAGSGNIVTG